MKKDKIVELEHIAELEHSTLLAIYRMSKKLNNVKKYHEICHIIKKFIVYLFVERIQ